MSDELKQQLAAAEETIAVLCKRLRSLEGGGTRSLFHQQLLSYQDRIESEQKKLRDSQDWARLLVENALDAIVGMDNIGLITHWNPRAEEMFGWKEAEVIGKPVADVLIPDSLHDSHNAGMARYLQGVDSGRVVGRIIEVTVLCKDGFEVPVELAVSMMKRDADERFIAFLRDISERKQAELSLKESNENLERLVEEGTRAAMANEVLLGEAQNIANIGTFDFDLTTGAWKGGGNLDAIMGVDANHPRNIRGWLSFIHPDERASVWSFLNDHVYGTDEASTLECRVVRADNHQERWVLCHGKPFFDGQGKAERLLGTIQDITERKLFEENFRQAQKMEAVGTLVGGVAHEFNNTLAGITGRLYLAKKVSKSQPDVMRNLEKIDELGGRAADMIQQLLAFSRKSQIQMSKFNLSSFMTETLKLHRFSIPENIQIDTAVANEALPIKGDRTQVQQILVNLLNNARDAVEAVAQPNIRIQLATIESASLLDRKLAAKAGRGRYARLTVSDNGSGISEQDLKHIYEPFFTTKEVGKGTGLGLAMVYGAVQTHHALLDVESKEGVGTSFHVYFPLSSTAGVQVKSQPKLSFQGEGEVILLVDDEQALRETGREVLEALGYSVLEAANGQEAVKLYSLHEHEIAIVIMDVVMPIMGGMEAARKIWQQRKDMKVIFCTGYDRNEVLDDKGLSNPLVLSKPYAIDELSQMIREHLHQ